MTNIEKHTKTFAHLASLDKESYTFTAIEEATSITDSKIGGRYTTFANETLI